MEEKNERKKVRKKMGVGVGRKEATLTFFRTEKGGSYNESISTDLLGKSWLGRTTFICELDFEKKLYFSMRKRNFIHVV